MPVLDVRDIEVVYLRRDGVPVRAVAGASLSVDAGEIVGLVGETGCGKSSLARAAVGLVRPDAGEVLFEGQPLHALGRRLASAPRNPPADGLPESVWLTQPAAQDRRSRSPTDLRRRAVAAAVRCRLRRASAWPSCCGGSGSAPTWPSATRTSSAAANVSASPSPARWRPIPHHRPRRAAVGARRLGPGAGRQSAGRARARPGHGHAADLARPGHRAPRGPSHGRHVPRQDRRDGRHRRSCGATPRHPYTRALIEAIPAPDGAGHLPVALAGEIPDPAGHRLGCRFHPRCPYVFDRCSRRGPVLLPTRTTAPWPAGCTQQAHRGARCPTRHRRRRCRQ